MKHLSLVVAVTIGRSIALLCLINAAPVFCQIDQTLPDAPTVNQTDVHRQPTGFKSSWALLRDGSPAVSNKEVLKDPVFLGTTLAFAGALIFDSEVTEAGIAHHRCVEKTVNPPYPSRAELYKADIWQFIPIVGYNFLMTKARMRWLSVISVAGAGVHVRGGIQWINNCW
jgi:hypothetical protein